MKILVTGGAGFIGSHVVDTFIANGHEVVVVDDLSTGRRSNLNPAATFYQVDIRSPQMEEIFEKERPDFVDHHAAQMDVRRSVENPLFDADVNVLGSINLIELAKNIQLNASFTSQLVAQSMVNQNIYHVMNHIRSIPFVHMGPASTQSNITCICTRISTI